MTARRTIVLAALVALLQIGFLSWSIMGRATILRDGREVLLKVEPVDPRDFLRGDYVRLGYEIGQIPANILAKAPEAGRDYEGSPVWVRLEKGADNYWRPVAANLVEPLPTPVGPEQVDIKGTVPRYWDSAQAQVSVDYGIGRYYVPEGEGLAIEQGIGVRPFGIVAAVSADGAPQIKALMDGDKRLYEEPPY